MKVGPFFSEDEFRAVERVLTNGEVSLDLRSELDVWVLIYAEPYRFDDATRRHLDAIAGAAKALHRSLAALDERTAWHLAFELDVIRHDLFRTKESEAARLLDQLATHSAELEKDVREVLARHRLQRGRPDDPNYWGLMVSVADAYQKRTGHFPSVTTSSLGDVRGRGTDYGGRFFSVARIIDHAAARATGRRPKSATALGRWLKRFTATRLREPITPDLPGRAFGADPYPDLTAKDQNTAS
jgi:hypothetical protein